MQTLKLTCTIAAVAAVSLTGGCKSTRTWDVPESATPEYEARQIAKSEELVREAQRFEVAGKPDKALEKYELAISAYTENPTAWHNAGLHYARRGENLKAANAFKTAAELSPRDPRPLYELGALWEQLGYLDDAARWYDDALQRDPNHQNSLRRSILVDELRHKLTSITADRLKIAIVAEREPWWINRFQRVYQLMGENQTSPLTDDSRRPAPEAEAMPPDSISLPGVEPHRNPPRQPSANPPAAPGGPAAPSPHAPASPVPPASVPRALPKS